MPLSQRLSRLPKTHRRLHQRQVARTHRERGSAASSAHHRHRRQTRVYKPKHTRRATSPHHGPHGARPSVRAPKSRGGEDIVKTVMNAIDKDNKQAVTSLFGGRTIVEHKLLSKDPYPITYIKLARGSCVRQDIIVHGTKDEFVEMFNLREKLCAMAFRFIVKCCVAFGRLLSMTPGFIVGLVKMTIRLVFSWIFGAAMGVVKGAVKAVTYMNEARKDIMKGRTLRKDIKTNRFVVRYRKQKPQWHQLGGQWSSEYTFIVVQGESEQLVKNKENKTITYTKPPSRKQQLCHFELYQKDTGEEGTEAKKRRHEGLFKIQFPYAIMKGFKLDKDGIVPVQGDTTKGELLFSCEQPELRGRLLELVRADMHAQGGHNLRRTRSSHSKRPYHTRRSHSTVSRRTRKRARFGGNFASTMAKMKRTLGVVGNSLVEGGKAGAGMVSRVANVASLGLFLGMTRTIRDMFSSLSTDERKQLLVGLSLLKGGVEEGGGGSDADDAPKSKRQLVLKRKKALPKFVDDPIADDVTLVSNRLSKHTFSAVNSRVFQNYSFYEMYMDNDSNNQLTLSKLGASKPDTEPLTWSKITGNITRRYRPSLHVEYVSEESSPSNIVGYYKLDDNAKYKSHQSVWDQHDLKWTQQYDLVSIKNHCEKPTQNSTNVIYVGGTTTVRDFRFRHLLGKTGTVMNFDATQMKCVCNFPSSLSKGASSGITIPVDHLRIAPHLHKITYGGSEWKIGSQSLQEAYTTGNTTTFLLPDSKHIKITTKQANPEQIKEEERRYILYYEVKPSFIEGTYQHAFHEYDSTHYADIKDTSFEPPRALQTRHENYHTDLEVEAFNPHQLTLYYHSTDASRPNTGMCGFYSMGTGKTKCGQLFFKHYCASSPPKRGVLIAPEQVVDEFMKPSGFLDWDSGGDGSIQPVTFEDLMHKRETLTQLIDTLQNSPDPNTYVLVIDEAHRLYSLFYESSHPHDLLETLFHTIRRTHKRLLLTGTPLYFGVPTLSILVNICQAPTDTDPLIPFNEREFRRRYYKTVMWKKFMFGWLVPILNLPVVKNGFILFHVTMVARYMYSMMGYMQAHIYTVRALASASGNSTAVDAADDIQASNVPVAVFPANQMLNTVNSAGAGVYISKWGSMFAAFGLLGSTVAAIIFPLIVALLFNMVVEALARIPLDTIEVLREELLADAIQQYVMFYSVINLEQEIAVDPYDFRPPSRRNGAGIANFTPLPVYPLPTEYRIQLTYNTEQNLYFLDMTRMGNSVGELDVLFDKDKSLSENEQTLLGEMTDSKFSLFRTIEKEEMYIQHGVGIGNLHLDKVRDCNPASISALEKMVTISANYEKYYEDLKRTHFLFHEGKQYSPKIFDVLMRVAMYEMVLKGKRDGQVPQQGKRDGHVTQPVPSKSVIYSSFVKAGVDQIREFVLVLRKLRQQLQQSEDTSLADFLDPFHDDDKNSECPKAKNIKSARLRINRESTLFLPRFSGVRKEDQYEILHKEYCQYANTAPKKKMEFKCTKVELKKPGTHYTKMIIYTEDVYGRIRTGDKLTLTPVHLYSSSVLSTRRAPTGANSMPIQGTVEEVGKDTGGEFCVLDLLFETVNTQNKTFASQFHPLQKPVPDKLRPQSAKNQAAIKSWRGFMSNFVNVDESGNDTITMSKQWAKNPAHKYIQFEVHQNTNHFVFPISTEQISTKLGIGSHTLFDSRYCKCPHCVTLTDVGSFLYGSEHKLKDLIDTICRLEFGVLNEDYKYEDGTLKEIPSWRVGGRVINNTQIGKIVNIDDVNVNGAQETQLCVQFEHSDKVQWLNHTLLQSYTQPFVNDRSVAVTCTYPHDTIITTYHLVDSQSGTGTVRACVRFDDGNGPLYNYTVDQNIPCNSRNYFSLEHRFYVPHNARYRNKDYESRNATTFSESNESSNTATFFESIQYQRSLEPEGFPCDLYQRHFDQPFLLSFYSKTKVFFVVPGVSVIAFVIEDGVLKYREQALNFGKAKVVLTAAAAISTVGLLAATAGLFCVVPAAVLATLRIGLLGFKIQCEADKNAGQPVNITLTKKDSFGKIIKYKVKVSMSEEGRELKVTVEEDVTDPYGAAAARHQDEQGEEEEQEQGEARAPTPYTGPAKQYHCTKTKLLEAQGNQTIIRWDKYIPSGDNNIYGPWFTLSPAEGNNGRKNSSGPSGEALRKMSTGPLNRKESFDIYDAPNNQIHQVPPPTVPIRVPIINQSHTEGLNLKSFKQLFLLEPVPNPAMEDQLKARVIRFNDEGYDEGENRVSVYHYEMVANSSLFTRLGHWRNKDVRNKDVHSTDRIFWKRFQQFSQSRTPDNLCLEKNVKMRKELSKFEKKLPECLQDSHIESIGGKISVLEDERRVYI